VAVAKWDSIALTIEPCQKNGMSSVATEVEHRERTKRLRPPTSGEMSRGANVGVGAAGNGSRAAPLGGNYES
jgi:hypothetical protein